MEKKVGKITVAMNEDQLLRDIEKYKKEAIQLGATNATLVKAEEIPVEDAVVRKCQVPRCWGYGVSAHCPPHALKPAELREWLKDYHWGLFFVRDLPTEILLRDRKDKDRIAAYRSIFDIVNKLESMAFYDGHYLTFGFGAGSCKNSFCGQHETCRALEGKSCRFSVLSRSSMEAVGINVYKMVASAGWEIYPIGRDAKPEDAPKGVLAGIVIVG